MQDELMALALRCEQATLPDFPTEREIALACGWTFKLVTHDDDIRDVEWRDPAGKSVQGHPFFMRRVDDAMLLAPDDPWIEIKGPRKYLNIPTHSPNVWSASVSQWNHEGDATGWGATAALAVTAACLKVRSRATLARSDEGAGE